MANNANQKLRLLAVYKILLEETDEEHPLNSAQIIEKLEEQGIDAERKTIYSDIRNLEEAGMDICKAEDARSGYYVASNVFELAELKLLVDAVSASKFITEKKSKELVEKIGQLTSKHGAKQLTRNVHLANRAKSRNESAFYITDYIFSAMQDNRKISFKYWAWDVNCERVPRKDGAAYIVSPGELVWFDENYYLVAYSDERQEVRYYRVDKMSDVKILDEARCGMEELKQVDISRIAKESFNMFDGQSENVTFLLKENLVGVFIDRFGQDIAIRPKGDGMCTVRCNVQVSPTFYGWVTGLGADVSIQSPLNVVEGYKLYIGNILKQY